MIIIVAYEALPDCSPGAIRCISLASAYSSFGHKVIIFHKGILSSAGNPEIVSCYKNNKFKKKFGFSKNVIKHLDLINRTSKIEAVITYGFFNSLNSWCKVHNIENVVDVVEWYSKEQFKHWYLSLAYFKKELDIRRIVKSKANVIAITTYLENYFIKQGCRAVRIPIMAELPPERECRNLSFEKIRIIYAGSHLMMDNIITIIKTLCNLDVDSRKRIEFSIYGLNRERIYSYLPDTKLAEDEGFVTINGHRPNQEIIQAYKQSHYSIVIRDPNLRVNQAGFPSKVIESMKMGVPVICNYSSDLNLYLKDNVNSIIVEDISQDSLTKTFLRVLKIKNPEYSKLSLNAQNTIEKEFHISAYSRECEEIIR